jgi:hypothetical protein
MDDKSLAFVNDNNVSILYSGNGETGAEISRFSALNSNIQESLDEIDILRGTVQYWESRPAAIDPRERAMVTEAYRVMYGELLGLTARIKDLLDRAGRGGGA